MSRHSSSSRHDAGGGSNRWPAEKPTTLPSPAFNDSWASLIQHLVRRSLEGTGRGLLKVLDQVQAKKQRVGSQRTA